MLTRLNLPQVLDADHTELAPDAEAAQPLYARYWLHNRGPAPLGGLPAVAHLHPPHIDAEPNTGVRLRLTAASDCSDTVLHGRVRLLCPDGLDGRPGGAPFMLPPGEHLETDVAVDRAAGGGAGLVSGASGARSDRPARVDAARMASGRRGRVYRIGGAPPTDSLLRLVSEPQPVDVEAGDVGPAGGHRRHRRLRGHRRRSPPDQPVGDMGVDRARGVGG